MVKVQCIEARGVRLVPAQMFCAGSALTSGLAHAVAAEIVTRATSGERGSQRRMLAPAATLSPDVKWFPVLVISGWSRKPHARCEQSTFRACLFVS
jgi:hypothetical protein